MARQSALRVCLSELSLPIALVLLVAVLAVACGGQPAAPSPTQPAAQPAPTTAAAAPAPTSAPAAAPTAAPAAKKVDYPTKTINVLAPSKPGSGFDTTARAVVTALEKEKLVPVSLPVANASGSVEGMAEFQRYKGDPYHVAVQSITLLLNKSSGMSPYGNKEITPIAGLISTNYGFVVRADSPYKNLMDLMKDLKEKPDQTPLTGGQSDDRIAYGAAALAVGADLTKINYAAFAGGTEASATLLEGTAKAEITTVDDILGLIESGKVRVLATSGATRMSGIFQNVPTFKEAGLNLEWSNFRYWIGPPGMPDYGVAYWKDVLGKMVKTPTWKDTMTKYRWVDNWIPDNFDKYMEEKAALIDKVSADLGLKK